MNRLHELLDDATCDPIAVDVAADVRRGRRALARRRTWWSAAATGAVVAVAGTTYAGLPLHHTVVSTVGPADRGTSVPPLVEGTYFDVPRPPDGWHVVGQRPQYVMISRDGSGTSVDSSFVGQLMILMADGHENFGSGRSIEYDGRTFHVNDHNADATIVSVRDPGGHWLQAQYPKGTFTDREMIGYLDGVVVERGAQPGLG